MSFAKLRLIVAAMLFVGWLGWLGYAVSQKGTVQIVSRAQLAGAKYWAIVEVQIGENGLPLKVAKVKRTIKRDEKDPELDLGAIEIENLHRAKTPVPGAGGSRDPVAGEYLIPLVDAGRSKYQINGLPRSPGVEAQDMNAQIDPPIPLIYPWTPDVEQQLSKYLGR